METSGMIRKDGYERISSSGMVFNAKPVAKGNSNNAQVNGILIRIIEGVIRFFGTAMRLREVTLSVKMT